MTEGYDAKTCFRLDRINDDNFADFCLQLGALGEVYRGPDVKWAYTGGPALNRVVDMRFTIENADARISEIMDMFAARDAKPAWVTSPLSTPVDMTERLQSIGYHYIPWKGMALDMPDLPDELPVPESFEITEITDAAMIASYADVVARGFGWIESIHEPVKKLFTELGVCNSIPWRHYLGLLDGKPASAVTIYESAGVSGVYFVATAPEARRRGLGIYTTWYSLKEAKKTGPSMAVLQASPMGKGVYEKIGFKTHGDMGLFLPFTPTP